jgi:hypothetical protein
MKCGNKKCKGYNEGHEDNCEATVMWGVDDCEDYTPLTTKEAPLSSLSSVGLDSPMIKEEKINDLIYKLDRSGREYDRFDYGLPVNTPMNMGKMREIVREWLKAL